MIQPMHFPGLRHQPVTTAHLAQTMYLLCLTAEELQEKIEKELASNPAIEMVEERRCPNCRRLLSDHGACPICSRPMSDLSDEPVVFVSPRDDFFPKSDRNDDDVSEDQYTSSGEDLPTYVLKQVAPELERQDRIIAAYLVSHFDEDGLLTIQLVEVARYFHQPISKIEKIQKIIQHAEPVGVGSSSVQDALLVQLEVLGENQPVPELAKKIISEGMDHFTRHQYSELAKQFKVTVRQIQSVVKFISNNLYPFPARAHWGDVRQITSNTVQVYHQPDIIIGFLNDDPKRSLVVEIIMPIHGTLRVNPLFRQSIQQAPAEKREEWKNDLERASLFVKCLQQRNHTMQRMMQRIVSMQKTFILEGEKHLKPVTRAQIAHELEVHESTISRAVASKCVQLPNKRIISLAKFFDRSLNVRTVLCDIIAHEVKPLSDTELSILLDEKGFQVARRTVAKYRAKEGILPAHLRHASNVLR